MEDTRTGEANGCNNNANNEENRNRKSVQEAIAKSMELRAIHSALMQSNNKSPAKMRSGFVTSPVSSHGLYSFTAQDYPVFTPSYEDDPLQNTMGNSRNYAESWGEHNLHGSSIKGHIRTLLDEDRNSITDSFTNNLKAAPRGSSLSSSPVPNNGNYSKSRRNSLGDANSVSSCNKCNPPMIISSEPETTNKKLNITVPLTDSHLSLDKSRQRNKGIGFSRLFSRLTNKKKKNKNEDSLQNDLDMFVSVEEELKRELIEANESRDLALTEVSEMKSSLGELSHKLEYLESYCEELRKALRQALQLNVNPQSGEKLSKIPNMEKSTEDYSIPVSEQVMVEGFLQIVSEARLSVKQLCKALLFQIDEIDRSNLSMLLQSHNLSLDSKHSKPVQYHLESIINQSLYQDFENRAFQRNGASKILNLNQERLCHFQSFVALRNLSWNEVLRKGNKCYSEEFSKFCDVKMNGVITYLGWTKPWPEHMLQGFFVAAKRIWLLHLLAFSVDLPLRILRVDENAMFDGNYMEDVFGDRLRSQGTSRVKVMVVPGFYVVDRVVKCKVLCR